MKGQCDLCSSRHTFEHPVKKTCYLKAKKDRVAVMSCWGDLKKIIQKLSFTHSTSCLPKPILLSLDLRNCYDISHEIRTITWPLQTVLRSSAMTSWSRFLSCAHKAAESENTGYLNIQYTDTHTYTHTQPIKIFISASHCHLHCWPTACLINDLLPDLIMMK